MQDTRIPCGIHTGKSRTTKRELSCEPRSPGEVAPGAAGKLPYLSLEECVPSLKLGFRDDRGLLIVSPQYLGEVADAADFDIRNMRPVPQTAEIHRNKGD